MNGIYWLASYPKSGNTWTRSFIYAILNPDKELDINELATGAIASSRQWIESGLGFEINQLDHDEVDRLRPPAYRWLSRQVEGYGYHKIHDAYTYLPDGTPLFPKEAALGALYIIRNPLDVALSYANHNGQSVDQTIRQMRDPDHAFCGSDKRFVNQIRQRMLSWSEHVNSWLPSGLNLFTVRYEDMTGSTEATFKKIAEFLQLPSDEHSVATALEKCSFDRLKAQEKEKGFREKPIAAAGFFDNDILGDWKTALTKRQVTTILHDHREVMQAFGYADVNGNPIET